MDTMTAIETAETTSSRKLFTKRSEVSYSDCKDFARKAYNRADRKAGKAVCRAALRSW